MECAINRLMSDSRREVFIITFLSYTAVHCMRTSYSSIKPELTDACHTSIQAIGIVDALILLFLGIGHFVHAIFPIKNPVRSLWTGLLSCSVIMAVFAISFNMKELQNYWILAILMCFNGYMQSYTWPMLLMIVHSKFDPKKHNILLGFWATNSNFGNIIGFGVSKLIFIIYPSDWTLIIGISAVYTSIFGLLVYFRFKELPSAEDRKIDSDEKFDEKSQITSSVCDQLPQSEPKQQKSVLKNPTIILLTIIFSLTKSVIYGILLWLPLYFKSSDQLRPYAADIPITYEVAAILGSVLLGHIFEKIHNKGFLLNPFMIVLLIAFTILRFAHLTIFQYFLIIAIVGFSLGGTFNTLSGLIVMQLVKTLPPDVKSKKLGFYSAATMAVGNVTTALTQILIGFVIGRDNQKKIFLVFIIYAATCVFCLLALQVYTYFKEKKSTKINQDDSYERIA